MRCTTSVSMACSTPSGNWLLIASSSWPTAFCVGESIFGTACSMSASRADRSPTVAGSPMMDRMPLGQLGRLEQPRDRRALVDVGHADVDLVAVVLLDDQRLALAD